MTLNHFSDVFTAENLRNLFPEDRADAFFEALYGDAEDGAYDIRLAFNKAEDNTLYFDFLLEQRPGKCIACNLTYGLPTVFERHPIINLNGLARDIEGLLDHQVTCSHWKVGTTREKNRQIHKLPVQFTLTPRNT
ncbi:pancreas/duodenum homeobox protein 1 [Desulfocicer niacini]